MKRIHDLTLGNLDDLPTACRSCVFWETLQSGRGGHADPQRGRAAKEAWWQATQLEWGTPGKAVYVEDQLAGYALFGPAEHFARVRRLGRTISDDALLLATLWIHPGYRSEGLARLLLHSVLRETHRRGERALEAVVERTGFIDSACVMPEAFLLANGFTVRYEAAVHPILRLDLRQTARWQESVGHAIEGVITALSRRERTPARAKPALEAVRTG